MPGALKRFRRTKSRDSDSPGRPANRRKVDALPPTGEQTDIGSRRSARLSDKPPVIYQVDKASRAKDASSSSTGLMGFAANVKETMKGYFSRGGMKTRSQTKAEIAAPPPVDIPQPCDVFDDPIWVDKDLVSLIADAEARGELADPDGADEDGFAHAPNATDDTASVDSQVTMDYCDMELETSDDEDTSPMSTGAASVQSNAPSSSRTSHQKYHRQQRFGEDAKDEPVRPIRKRKPKHVSRKRLAELEVTRVALDPTILPDPAQKVAGSRRRAPRRSKKARATADASFVAADTAEATATSTTAPMSPAISESTPTLPDPTSTNIGTLPVTSTGYIAKRLPQTEQDIVDGKLTADELVNDHGFTKIRSNGTSSRLIVGRNGEPLGYIAGRPREKAKWDAVIAQATATLENLRNKYSFKANKKHNRRGKYKFVNCGLSYGGGQKRVQNISQGSKHNTKLIAETLKDTAIRRLAGFVDACFVKVAPRVYDHYHDTICTILENDPRLKPNFYDNVFGAATFNLGPEVATLPHTDHMNYVSGWCAIIALGNFNYHRGGHLVLWDLKLVIEFPPGTLIFIPSALLRHSNTPIGRGETRMSFTQFSAGGLFRWVDCGCMTQRAYEAAGKVLPKDGRTRWFEGLARFDRWETLVARGLASRR